MLKRILLHTWPFILALITFACVEFGIHHPWMIEKYYSEGIYPLIATTLSFFSSVVPFSLWDMFWIIFTLIILFALFLVIRRRLKFSLFALRLFQSLALMYTLFYFSWGFNYFRPKIAIRSDWIKPAPDESFFSQILDSIIVNTNKSYTQITASDYITIDSLIENSYKENSRALGINYPNGTRVPKRMILSWLFAKSGVTGYFGPFFNEIQVNSYLLPFEYPFTLAHEKAHQFGMTEESEANFAAFVVCSTSQDPRLRYSGNMQLLLYFLSDAHQLKNYKEYVDRIDKRVINDIQNERKYWREMENKTIDKIQTAANNAYLKTNRIPEGVKNYNKVVSLVLSWYYNKMDQSKNNK